MFLQNQKPGLTIIAFPALSLINGSETFSSKISRLVLPTIAERAYK